MPFLPWGGSEAGRFWEHLARWEQDFGRFGEGLTHIIEIMRKNAGRFPGKVIMVLSLFLLGLSVIGQDTIPVKEQLSDPGLGAEERFRILSRLTVENWKVSPNTSLIYGKEALALANELENPQMKAEIVNYLGVAHYYNNEFSLALEYLLEALTLRQELGDEKLQATTLNNIGNVYLATGSHDQAIEYYLNSLALKERNGLEKQIPSTLINLASLYNSKGDQEKAFDYIHRAIDQLEGEPDAPGLSSAWSNLASIYRQMGKLRQAVEMNRQALEISQRLEKYWEIAYVSNSLAEIYIELNDFENAFLYLEKGLEAARQVSTRDVLMQSYRVQTLYYSALGNRAKFREAFGRFDGLKDSIFSEQNSRALAEMQVIYETEQKEKENAIQRLQIEKERSLRNSFIFISLIVIILVIIIYSRYRVKQRLNAELEKKVEQRTADLRESHERISGLNKELLRNQEKLKEAQRIGKIGSWDYDFRQQKFSSSRELGAIFSIAGENRELGLEHLLEKIHPADRQWLSRVFEGDFEGSSRISFDLRQMEAQKISKYLSLQGEVHFDGEGQPAFIQGTIQDITERKSLEQALLSNTIEIEERERRRFSEDLHDGLGPLLSTVKIHLELIEGRKANWEDQAKMIRMASDLVDDAIASTREIANNLTPNILNDFGLFEAIKTYVNKITSLGSLEVELQIPETGERLPKQIELAFYRITLELVNNTLKHARATRIRIHFSICDHHLELDYSDNGVGLHSDGKTTPGKLGLQNIISRVKSVEGSYSLRTGEGKGFGMKIGVKLGEDLAHPSGPVLSANE